MKKDSATLESSRERRDLVETCKKLHVGYKANQALWKLDEIQKKQI